MKYLVLLAAIVLSSCQNPTEPVVKHEMPQIEVVSITRDDQTPTNGSVTFRITYKNASDLPSHSYIYANDSQYSTEPSITERSASTIIIAAEVKTDPSQSSLLRSATMVNKFSWTADSLVTTAIIYSM